MPLGSTTQSQDVRAHVGEVEGLRTAYRDACEGRLSLLVVDGSRAAPGASITEFVAGHRAGPLLRVDARQAGALSRLVHAALSMLSPLRRSRHPARRWLEREVPGRSFLDLQSEAERRFRLRNAAVDLLNELGRDNPCVLILEGAERPERALLDVVTQLSSRSERTRGTRRRQGGSTTARSRAAVLTVAVSDGPPCRALSALARGEQSRRLTLEPLTRDGVRAMLSRDDVVDAVFALTGGHPERLTQLLRSAESRSDERSSPGASSTAVHSAPLPIQRLAVLARPVPEKECSSLLFADRPLLDDAVSGLMRAGAVLREGAWSLPTIERERVLTRMPVAHRRSVQASVAEALSESHPAEAAHHAVQAGELELALRLAESATDQLSADLAWIDAAELLRGLAEALGRDGRRLPHALHVRLIDSCWVAGAHEEAIRYARQHYSAARTTHDGSQPNPQRADVTRRLGLLLSYAGQHREAVSLLEEARAQSPVDLQLVAALAEAHYRNGDLTTAEQGCEAVLASSMAARSAVFDARQTQAKAAMARGDTQRAESLLSALAADDSDGQPVPARVRCQALNNLAILAMSRSALPQAGRLLVQAVELAEEHASVFHLGIALKNLAAVAQLEGRWEDAIVASDRALQLLSGIADPSLRARLAFNTADLHRSLGDAYRAGRLCSLARAGADGARNGDAGLSRAVDVEGRRVEAAIAEELGQLPEALRRWEAATDRGVASSVEANLGRVRVLHALGRVDEARDLFAGVRLPTAPRDRARHLHCAALLGRVPEARLALEGAEATGDPLLAQEARLRLAEALADAGLSERSADELEVLRRLDARLATQVHEPLRTLFEERRLVRRAMLLAERLAQRDGRLSTATPTPAAPREGHASAMLGSSAPMKRLRHVIGRVAPTEGTVLLTGESGSGKELAAEALHARSQRAGGTFLKLNCAALVDALLASELFGHERGAFTGAESRKPGHFERANGGTLLLDEIGDISPHMQAALLRVLQEGTFERVGGTQTQHVDVRVIAATHRDLAEEVRAGRFREDLYYRLSGITVHVPSLRERRSDIGPLARHLLAAMAPECGEKALAPDAVTWLQAQPWPGNVRQLDNVLRRVAVLTASSLLTESDFAALAGARDSRPPTEVTTPSASLAELAYERVRDGEGSIYELRKRLERELIERALNDAGGNISRAAEWLGMKRPRLSKLVNEWGLK